jgi:phosphoribosylamine--glycine ligase
MGDPETEVVMPRLKNDLVELFIAVNKGTLSTMQIQIDGRACATVVAVSGGYPGGYSKNIEISGLEKPVEDVSTIVFHAGTKKTGDAVLTNGGRVLAVTSYGNYISEAVEKSKKTLRQIHFKGMYYRNDIGHEFKNIK